MGRTVSLRSQETQSAGSEPSGERPTDILTGQPNMSHSSMANESAPVHEDTLATQPGATQPNTDTDLDVQPHLNSIGVWLLAGQHLSR